MAAFETALAFLAVAGGSYIGLNSITDNRYVAIVITGMIAMSQISVAYGIFSLSYLGRGDGLVVAILDLVYFINSVPIEISAVIIVAILLYLVLSLEGFSTGTENETKDEDKDEIDRREMA